MTGRYRQAAAVARRAWRAAVGMVLCGAALGAAARCADDVLGTARVLTLPRQPAAYGRFQHPALPLAPGEVVITFDDGPRPGSTPAVLKALKAECVRATFFMVGEPMLAHAALAREVRAQGHGVGLHGHRHPAFAQLSEADQLADLNEVEAAYAQVFGDRAASFRYPFLAETPFMRATLAAKRYTVMSADAGVDDYLPDQSPQQLADRLVQRLAATGGGIVLLHDAQDATAAALPLLLRTLKRHGYRVVHLEWRDDDTTPASP